MENNNIRPDLLGELWEHGQQQQQQNENFEIEVDDDDAPDRERDGDGVLDGGVAASSEDGCIKERRSSECDLVLFLSCSEVVSVAPGHPILRPGVVVSIGLGKNTRLSAVFSRYVEFCNDATAGSSSSDQPQYKIEVGDLEFVHCQLLNPNDTAEASALMKNDRIHVRRVRTAERDAEAERKRLERDADRDYFKQLRHLMPDFGGIRTADVVFDCRGKLVDESGRNQQVLCTTVRGHSVILSKRCRWLGDIIREAKRQQSLSRSVVSATNTPENVRDDAEIETSRSISRVESESKADEKEQDEDDFGIEVLPFPPEQKNLSGAAEIENDDDEEIDESIEPPSNAEERETCRSGSPVLSSQNSSRTGAELLWVSLPDYSPEAFKLLLEYCYTNRVTLLGQDAFVQACKTKPHKHQGPVPPYQNSSSASRRWPNNGLPLVSFPVALAGISLAEEASMHRLSLMCEVAASQLVSPANVVEALSMCTTQKNKSGNSLPRLRQAAMDIVLRSGERGVIELERTPAFRGALDERASSIVPTLLIGTMEAVTSNDKLRVKRDWSTMAQSSFDELDREDSYKRERERKKRRLERWENDPNRMVGEHGMYDDELGDEFYDPLLSGWASETTKRSLKRMAHHLPSTFAAAVSGGDRERRGGDHHHHHHHHHHHAFSTTSSNRSYSFLGRRSSTRRRGDRG